MHPYESHKMLHKHRLGKFTKGYARGGHVEEHEEKHKEHHKEHKHEHEIDGKKAKGRADKYARGGRTKRGKTHVNINVMPQGPMQPQRVPVPVPVQSAPPPAAGMPPGGAPAGMPPRPPMAPGGGPPGMMPGMRSGGGRAFKRGGGVKDGPTWKEGLRNGTKVQHLPGKDNSDNLKKPYPITRASGGRADFGKEGEATYKRGSDYGSEGKAIKKSGDFGEKAKFAQVKHGAGTAMGRKEKIALQRRVYP